MEIRYPDELPVSAFRSEILKALRVHPVVIVSGDTGSGKTTQLPKMALEAGRGVRGRRIAVTQPRRLAAVTMATRVASELGETVGGLVGYQHRFARQVSRETRVKFLTDGVLLAETRGDPLLKAYDTIIVDEAHERSLNIDFLLGILKRILEKRRDLKVIVSSATLDVESFSSFFDSAPVISVPGRLYPIEIKYRPCPDGEERDLPREVTEAVRELPRTGDILVFLPGERDIRETAEYLTSAWGASDEIIPLLASLPASEQQRAFRTSSQRRIILATNVAETSVTIPGIRYVIDSGLARLARYQPRTQVERLQIEPISQASARQRSGRCGRLGPGVAVRLYSEEDFNSREPFTPPEILRSSLAGVILTMLDLGLGDLDLFPFIEAPRGSAIREGLRALLELGAITSGSAGCWQLTPTGAKLARVPVEPRLARMLLAASEWASLPSAIPVVAALACEDPRRRPAETDERARAQQAHAKFKHDTSDFLGLLKLWNWWCDETRDLSQAKARKLAQTNYLSFPRLREWRDLVRQLTDLCRELKLDLENDNGGSDALHRALMTGLLGRLGKFDDEARDYRGSHAVRFVIHPSSALSKKPPLWVMAGELVDTSRLFARTVAAIDVSWIERAAGDLVKRSYRTPEWDPVSGFTRVIEQVTLYGLVIVPARRRDLSRLDPKKARELFIRFGLVEGAFPRPPRLVRENTEFIAELARRAEKLRRPELFDAAALEDYFDRVLPREVVSADGLRKYLAAASAPEREAFRLKRDDWFQDVGAEPDDFPDFIRIGKTSLRLTYRHARDDDEEDGITCTVRRKDAAALRLWRADWLVPGALPAKLTWMLSVLPTALRRVLSPIDETVSGLLARLKPGTEPLEGAVRRAVYERWGFRIPEDAWARVKMPLYLQVQFEILSDDGKRPLAISRDLEAVLEAVELRQATGTGVTTSDSRIHTTWDFGSLQQTVKSSESSWEVTHYLALHDEGTGVTVRLYGDESAAVREHAAGVVRLFVLALADRVKHPLGSRRLPFDVANHLESMRYSEANLAKDVFEGAVRAALVAGRDPVRDEHEFQRRLEAEFGSVLKKTSEWSARILAILESAARLTRLIASESRLCVETVEDATRQLAWLVFRSFPRFVSETELARYPRYLKGLEVRLSRAQLNPSGDRTKRARFEPYWQRYQEVVTGEARDRYDAAALSDYRWMLEQYRISLFAQELKTDYPVSPERLDAKWREAEKGII